MIDSEERFKILFEHAPDAHYLNDLSGNFIEGNKMAEKLTGYDRKELIGKIFLKLKLLSADQIPKAAAALAKNALGHTTGPDKFTLTRKDGGSVEVEINTHPVKIKGKLMVFGSVRDISEREKQQRALKLSEARYRMIFENAIELLVQIDNKGKILDLNNRAMGIGGYKKEEFVGKNISVLAKNCTKQSLALILFNFSRRMLGFEIKPYEVEARKENGEQIFLEISAVRLKNEKGENAGELASLHDITDQKRAMEKLKKAQELLIQAEKMSALGQLASGVAHEVKNPLGIIIQAVNLLETTIGSSRKQEYETLILIKDAVKRADGIIKGLLNFSKPAELELKPTNINEVIDFALNMVMSQLQVSNIKIKKMTEEALPPIMLDDNKIKQVLINIFLNSLQAMTGKGELTVKVFTKENILINKKKALICEIYDTGAGIPKEKLAHVFDPFFTTKPPGEGAGLGLSVSRTIVAAHGGTIKIESEAGKGTKTRITLPIRGD
ncbi:PAS domain S-box protein [Candidatus Margulisiibacteriota bacterium]